MTRKGDSLSTEQNYNHFIDIDKDNKKRAEEIVSTALPREPAKRSYRHKKPKKGKNFTPEERANILARVRKVGVARAAEEAGTTTWVIMKWLDRMERTMTSTAHAQPQSNNNVNVAETATTEDQVAIAANEAIETTEPKEGIEDMDEKVTTASTEQKKAAKDLTPEERVAIVQRAKEIGPAKAAEEFGTTWQAVGALLKAERKAESGEASPKKGGKKRKHASKKTDDSLKKKFTPEEVAAILARTDEVGAKQAAEEFGTTGYAIGGWRKAARMKAAIEASDTPAPRKERKPRKAAEKKPQPEPKPARVKAAKPTTAEVKAPAAPKPATPAKPLATVEAPATRHSALELENALLKEKLASLTDQVEKLRSAISQMAQLM